MHTVPLIVIRRPRTKTGAVFLALRGIPSLYPSGISPRVVGPLVW
jgi:hypothetical protein